MGMETETIKGVLILTRLRRYRQCYSSLVEASQGQELPAWRPRLKCLGSVSSLDQTRANENAELPTEFLQEANPGSLAPRNWSCLNPYLANSVAGLGLSSCVVLS